MELNLDIGLEAGCCLIDPWAACMEQLDRKPREGARQPNSPSGGRPSCRSNIMYRKMPKGVERKLAEVSEAARRQPKQKLSKLCRLMGTPEILMYARDIVVWHARRSQRWTVRGPRFQAELIEAKTSRWIQRLSVRVQAGLFRFGPVCPVSIPKPSGGIRELGVPSIKDRVVSTAMSLVLEAILDHTFLPDTHGFRPGRSPFTAFTAIEGFISSGYVFAVPLDIRKCFNNIHHHRMLALLARLISDKDFLLLVRSVLRSPVRRGRKLEEHPVGAHQGHAVSPILMNLYLTPFDRAFRAHVDAGDFKGRCIRYADDILILCPELADAKKALTWAKTYMENELALVLHEPDGGIRDLRDSTNGRADEEVINLLECEFLGLTVGVGEHGTAVWGIATEKVSKIIDQFREEVTRPMDARTAKRRLRSPRELADRFVREHREYYRPVSPETLERLDRQIRVEFTRLWPNLAATSITSFAAPAPTRPRGRTRGRVKAEVTDSLREVGRQQSSENTTLGKST